MWADHMDTKNGVHLFNGEQPEQDHRQVISWIREIESSCFNKIKNDQTRINCRAPSGSVENK